MKQNIFIALTLIMSLAVHAQSEASSDSLSLPCVTEEQTVQDTTTVQPVFTVSYIVDKYDKLVVNDKYTISKGDTLRIGQPWNGGDFNFVRRKSSLLAKLHGNKVEYSFNNECGIFRDYNKKMAMKCHAEISDRAKAIAGKKTCVSSWSSGGMFFSITVEVDRKKYVVNLPDALEYGELVLQD